jgi:YVTN family beta-propeller protein
MHKKVRFKQPFITIAVFMIVALALFVFSSCTQGPGATQQTLLYLFSTFKPGNVYTFDLESNTCSAESLFSYDTDAGDNAYFYGGRGYIAAASLDDPQLLQFDPADSTIISSAFVFEAYEWKGGPSSVVFLGPTKAYVTDSGSYDAQDFSPNNDGGVLVFNPSDTGSAWTKITDSDANCDGMTYIAGKNKVYVANSGSGTVSVIDTENDTENETEIAVDPNPTKIIANSDDSKVYVFCTSYAGNSTLKEIDTTTDLVTDTLTVTQGAGSPGAGLPSISGTKIYYSGLDDFWAGTGPFYIDIGEAIPSETPITTEVAGGSTLIYDNKLYVTNTSAVQSTLTIVDLADYTEVEGSPFDVGKDGDGIKGMAVY